MFKQFARPKHKAGGFQCTLHDPACPTAVKTASTPASSSTARNAHGHRNQALEASARRSPRFGYTMRGGVFGLHLLALVAGLLLMTAQGACRKDEAETATSETKTTPKAPSGESADAAAPSPEMVAILTKADAADGASDHVVSKCGMCALRMPGLEEHTSQVGDFTLHFCSEHCKESFDENPTKAVQSFLVGQAEEE